MMGDGRNPGIAAKLFHNCDVRGRSAAPRPPAPRPDKTSFPIYRPRLTTPAGLLIRGSSARAPGAGRGRGGAEGAREPQVQTPQGRGRRRHSTAHLCSPPGPCGAYPSPGGGARRRLGVQASVSGDRGGQARTLHAEGHPKVRHPESWSCG